LWGDKIRKKQKSRKFDLKNEKSEPIDFLKRVIKVSQKD